MKQEVNPQDTTRAQAFELWMNSPMPMVTFVKTFNVSRLRRISRRKGMKFNMLICWCIGMAAARIEEFYLHINQGKLFKFDCLAINVIVNNATGGINSCDIPLSDDFSKFCSDYDILTSKAASECKSIRDDDAMIVGTSAVTQTEIDCIVNQYTDQFTNPFIAWGRYNKGFFRTMLPISFQFHHVQMDGGQAARFLENLQKEINSIKI